MPAVASLEELKEVDVRLKAFRLDQPIAYEALCVIFKKYRKIGYKNICKLLLSEATPEKLKGEGGHD